MNQININHPIIQAPMLGVTTPEMVNAANAAGCLGSLPLGDYNYKQSVELIQKCKEITSQNFAVNIFIYDIPEITEDLKIKYDKVKSRLQDLSADLGFNTNFPDINAARPAHYHERIQAVLDENIKILSFTFGNLDDHSIETLKNQNVTLIGTCTNEAEANILIEKDIDMICVQGIEAGGHRGSFQPDKISKIGGFSLLQNIRKLSDKPLIYAGGINDKNSVLAAKTIGADFVQMGTALLCSKESALTPIQKQRLQQIEENEIILIKSFSGRYARGLKNKFTEIFENSDFVLPFPYQNQLTHHFRQIAKEQNYNDFLNLWCGQSYKNLSFNSTSEILSQMI